MSGDKVRPATTVVLVLCSSLFLYSVLACAIWLVALLAGGDPSPGDLTAATAIAIVALTANVLAWDMGRTYRYATGAVSCFAAYAIGVIVGAL